MHRRDSSDSSPSRISSESPSNRGSLSSSAILSHFSAITSSIQRRISSGITSSPPASPLNDSPRHFHESDPPLGPITLNGFSESTTERVLTEKLAEEIRLMMPTRLQVQENWDLVYSLDQHGVSLATLYSRCKSLNSPQAGFVVIVKDRRDNIFGAYLSDYPHVHPHYYGTGECFLYKFTLLSHTHRVNLSSSSSLLHPVAHTAIYKHDHPLSSGHHYLSSAEASSLSVHSSPHDSTRPSSSGSTDTTSAQYQFKGFSYTGLNDYMVLCTPQFLSVGGGYFTNIFC
jgi:TLD